MIKNYLYERKNQLKDVINVNTDKFNHNQISIEKNQNKIYELINENDEATNIFSVVVREDNGFKSKEISDIKEKIDIYEHDNLELEKIINQAKVELDTVNQCLDILDKQEKLNIEQEIIEQTIYETKEKEEIIVEYTESKEKTPEDIEEKVMKDTLNKLRWCKHLVKIDPDRTVIELDNIIKRYE